MARALILVRPSPAGGYVANARCNKHRGTRATGPTPDAAVAAVRAAHRLACACGWVEAAPVRQAAAVIEGQRADLMAVGADQAGGRGYLASPPGARGGSA